MIDRVLSVLGVDGADYNCDPADEPMLRGAVEQYLAEGENALLGLTLLGGSSWTVLASSVASWQLSTQAERIRDAEVVAALDAEVRDILPREPHDIDEDDEPWRGR